MSAVTLAIPSVRDCCNIVRALFAVRSFCKLHVSGLSSRLYVHLSGKVNTGCVSVLSVFAT